MYYDVYLKGSLIIGRKIMWIFSVGGVYSIVKKQNNYHIRCRRVHEFDHLKLLLKNDTSATFSESNSKYFDYKYRAITDSLDTFMNSIQDEITYANFKNHLYITRTEKDMKSFNSMYEYVYSANSLHADNPSLFEYDRRKSASVSKP